MISMEIITYIKEKLEEDIENNKTMDLLVLFESEKHIPDLSSLGEITFKFESYPLVLLSVDREKFAELLKIQNILAIEPDEYLYLQLNEATEYLKTDFIRNSFFGFSGKGITIGLIDSGIDETHPDLRESIAGYSNLTTESNEDILGHGTAIAGAICGKGKKSKGIFTGAAPDAKLQIYKLFNETGRCTFSEFIVCLDDIIIDFDRTKLDILCLPFSCPIPSFRSKIFDLFFTELTSLGCTIVTSAGNYGPDPGSIGVPGTSDYVITVGSFDENIHPAFFSSRGKHKIIQKPDLVAKGVNIITTKSKTSRFGKVFMNNKNYSIVSGTSMSTGLIAGIVAIIKEASPDLSPNEIKKELLDYAYEISDNVNAQGKGTFDLQTYFNAKGMLIQKPISYSKIRKNS